MRATYTFDATLWESRSEATWVFVTLPTDIADDIEERALPCRGFGSVKVRARIGSTEWSTSLFPDKESASYVLPIKQAVRARESIGIGVVATVTVEIVDD